MDWIKKNPAKFALGLAAVLAIAATVLLYTKVSAFDGGFDSVRNTSVSNAAVEKLDTGSIDKAGELMAAAVNWQPSAKDSGKLLVSRLYVLKDGKLIPPTGSMFHPPVPNEWLLKYKLDPLAGSVLSSDPDKDGFTTLEEWNGLDALSHTDNLGQPVMGADGKPLPDDSTDPTKPESHPPYHTKLELAKVVYIPFRLRVMSIDVPVKISKPSDVTVQINTIDLKNRTQYVVVGDDIPGTKFKIDSYEHKEIPDKDGTKKDVSEVTIINKETGAKTVLPLLQVVDSPDSYAVFRYKWVQPGGQATPDFSKRRAESFALPPEPDKTFKVEEIKGRDVIVTLPSGAKKTLTSTQ